MPIVAGGQGNAAPEHLPTGHCRPVLVQSHQTGTAAIHRDCRDAHGPRVLSFRCRSG